MDANNNNIQINRPCICGSLTHRKKRSKQCPFFMDPVKKHVSDEKEDQNQIENDNSKNHNETIR